MIKNSFLRHRSGRAFPLAPVSAVTSGLMALFLLVGCYSNSEASDVEPAARRTLNVATRATVDIPYPVRLFAFDAATGRVATSATLADATTETVQITLPEGQYHLAALAGMEECVVPEVLTQTDLITLPAAKTLAQPLMLGGADVTIASDVSIEVTLSYAVAAVTLSLSNLPDDISAVSVTLSSLYDAVDFAGDYSGRTSATVACTEQDGRQWLAPTFYVLPCCGSSLTLSVALTTAAGKQTVYSYVCSTPLEAGVPYEISGDYQSGFLLSGVITAEGWAEARTLHFTFGPEVDDGGSGTPSGSETAADSVIRVDAFPDAGTLWQGHFVAAIETENAVADVTFLSLKEWHDVAAKNNKENEAMTMIDGYEEDGISDWAIPTSDEAKAMKKALDVRLGTINETLTKLGGDTLAIGKDENKEDVRYLCEDGTKTFSWDLLKNNVTVAGTQRTYYLRAIRKVTMRLANE